MARRLTAGETYTVSATENIELGDVDGGVAGLMVVQLKGNAYSGTVTPKAKVCGAADASYTTVAYRNAFSEAVVAGSAITDPANTIIEINSAGRACRLDVVVTSGSVDITFRPILG